MLRPQSRPLRRPRRSRIRAAVAAISLITIAGPLGACSAADGDGSGAASDDASVGDAMLEFAACMREHGVPMEDPDPGGGGVLINGQDSDPETVEAAQEACEHLIEDALPDEGELQMTAEQKEALLAQAQCMRERGWDVPDPQFDGGRVMQRIGGDVNPEDPAFQADQEECAEESGVEMPQFEEGP